MVNAVDRFSYSARVKLRLGSVVRHICLCLSSVFCSVLTFTVHSLCSLFDWINSNQTNKTNNHSEVIKRLLLGVGGLIHLVLGI